MRDRYADIVPSVNPDVEIVNTGDMGVICVQKSFGYRIKLNLNTYKLNDYPHLGDTLPYILCSNAGL